MIRVGIWVRKMGVCLVGDHRNVSDHAPPLPPPPPPPPSQCTQNPAKNLPPTPTLPSLFLSSHTSAQTHTHTIHGHWLNLGGGAWWGGGGSRLLNGG